MKKLSIQEVIIWVKRIKNKVDGILTLFVMNNIQNSCSSNHFSNTSSSSQHFAKGLVFFSFRGDNTINVILPYPRTTLVPATSVAPAALVAPAARVAFIISVVTPKPPSVAPQHQQVAF